jgi:hypothetical protein
MHYFFFDFVKTQDLWTKTRVASILSRTIAVVVVVMQSQRLKGILVRP